MRLLDSLAEAAGREVYFAPVTFGSVVAEPVLQERCASLRRIEISSFSAKGHNKVKVPRN